MNANVLERFISDGEVEARVAGQGAQRWLARNLLTSNHICYLSREQKTNAIKIVVECRKKTLSHPSGFVTHISYSAPVVTKFIYAARHLLLTLSPYF